MKRMVYLFVLGLALLPAAAAAAFVEGQHYLEVSLLQPVEGGAKIEVREFFWYGCPHCYRLEPEIERWLKRKPANVRYLRTPGVAPKWLPHARAYYAFEALGAVDRVHAAFFRAVHEHKRALDDEASLVEFARENGVDAEGFRAALRSFGVRLQLEKARQLNVEAGIGSVPALLVDGRYLTTPTMAGGDAAVMKVVDYLIGQAVKARRKR